MPLVDLTTVSSLVLC